MGTREKASDSKEALCFYYGVKGRLQSIGSSSGNYMIELIVILSIIHQFFILDVVLIYARYHSD